jgi:hypothetical protein
MPEELLDDGNALGMLRAEHESIRQLLSNVLVRDEAFAQQALMRVREELEVHREMEKQCFIPLCENNIMLISEVRMADGTKSSMLFDELVSRLDSMTVAHPEFALTLEQLIRAFQQHCFEMEENLFIALEGGDWDMHQQLTACAIQMRDLRERMLASMNRPRASETPTFQELQHRRAQEQGRGVWGPRDVSDDEQLKRDEEGAVDLKADSEGNVMDLGRKSLDMDSEEGTTGR